MLGTRLKQEWGHPVIVWFVLLAVIFAIEYVVMLLLPWLAPQPSSTVVEAGLDAIVLTMLLAPLLWWTLVRPLQGVIRARTQFLADLFAQIEAERRQTATELHDGVGQVLTLLVSGLRSAKVCRATAECASRVNGFQELAENALVEVRRLALGLRPSLLDDLGLAPALERLVEDIRAHHPMDVALNVTELIGRSPQTAVATAVFRIVQESLANIIKHSQAGHAAVTVRWSERNLLVEISDDGCGISPARLSAEPPGHLGLRGMRQRAELLGGEFVIDSAAGQGTRLTITIPEEGSRRG